MIDLANRVALVTGAGSGIGAAAVHRLSQAGASVVLMARGADRVETLATKLRAEGVQALAVPGDVSRFDVFESAIQRAVEAFGRIDILVNNAGSIEPIARLADSDPEQWGAVADVNYKGVYHGIRAALPRMLAQGSGTIINISSGAATSALEGWSHYCSTKAAVLMLTRCTDKEYRAHGIRSIGLSPGTVATGMQVAIKASGINPVSRLDPSAHIPAAWAAEAIAWLCSPAGDAYLGDDFSLKTDEAKALVGLPLQAAA